MTTDTHTARNADTVRTWAEYPDRLVTASTGVVHVSTGRGFTLCATRSAVRATTSGVTPTCRNCGADPVEAYVEGPPPARPAAPAAPVLPAGTAVDTLGVPVLIGDTVTVTAWGDPVRLVDVGRTARVVAVNRHGRLSLDCGTDPDPIARGRAVSPGCLAVARRDGKAGHEGNAPAPVVDPRPALEAQLAVARSVRDALLGSLVGFDVADSVAALVNAAHDAVTELEALALQADLDAHRGRVDPRTRELVAGNRD